MSVTAIVRFTHSECNFDICAADGRLQATRVGGSGQEPDRS
jgi:hypothetical protein